MMTMSAFPVFGYEPHSVLPVGVVALADLTGFLPFSKIKSLQALLCIVVPGGVQETFHIEHGSEVVYLKNRKAFVRLANEKGCPRVPVFSFGQVLQVEEAQWKIVSEVLKSHKVHPNCFLGSFWHPLASDKTVLLRFRMFEHLCEFTARIPLPHQVPMHVVIDGPIEVKKNPEPTWKR
ncbi:hypothetical protein Cgig2_006302 [Carnegiea gigantea]|uniref:Uncharacterized protein n=1 Tax=Carnegiea gigantea TaxID=171969 RepID=A0A9Q1K8I3_9CARY|nr:hypothetical protein Cgig2_006302 [Carnegiea gigantea]